MIKTDRMAAKYGIPTEAMIGLHPPSGSSTLRPMRIIRQTLILTLFVASTASAQTVGLVNYGVSNLDGYVLFAPMPSTTTYLIDKCGRAVHTWPSTYKAGLLAYLLDDGTILRAGAKPNVNFTAGGRGGIIERIAWDGTVEWSYTISDADQCAHHDIYPMPNGNVLVIVWAAHTNAEAIALGRDTALLDSSLWSEKIVELQPVGTNEANIVWEWDLWDHLVQDFDNTKPNYAEVAEHPELLDFNYVPGDVSADWVHLNALDYNADLDQVILSSHELSEVWVIDHSTTTAEAATHLGGAHGQGGDFLYRWGNPQVYGRGTADDQVFFGQHNVQWIREGLERAGEILVFNNGLGRPAGPFSSIDIIASPVDANGDYLIDGANAYGPTALDYSWTADPPTSFYGSFISGAQVLPNGGIMACSGPNGTFVEIDADGNEVWRYVSPLNSNGPMTQGDEVADNNVFRNYWFAPNDPRLAGKDLTPGDPIELEPIANACIALAVDAVPGSSQMRVLPIPANDRLQVTGIPLGSTVDLLDMHGRTVRTWTVQSGLSVFQVASVPNGIYILRSSNSTEELNSRVVIAH